MWISESESASFWLNFLTDIRTRGVKDILMDSTDNIFGIIKAKRSAFPNTIIQLCVVCKISETLLSTQYGKTENTSLSDLKNIYESINREIAYDAFEGFYKKWAKIRKCY